MLQIMLLSGDSIFKSVADNQTVSRQTIQGTFHQDLSVSQFNQSASLISQPVSSDSQFNQSVSLSASFISQPVSSVCQFHQSASLISLPV